MGAACCCLRVEDFEDYVNPNSSIYRNCMCLSCFVQNFLNVVCFIVLDASFYFFQILLRNGYFVELHNSSTCGKDSIFIPLPVM